MNKTIEPPFMPQSKIEDFGDDDSQPEDLQFQIKV